MGGTAEYTRRPLERREACCRYMTASPGREFIAVVVMVMVIGVML
jgi:hypothetical protein